jgi:hypothetical protein
VAVAVILGVAAAGAGYAVWQQVRGHVLASEEYYVDPQNIVVTPQPPWIHSDIRAEVFQEASIDGPLSLLDSNLTVRMAGAFASHPWIANVERVSKRFPSSVEVVVRYRRPVAMVAVRGGGLPVDADSIVLPSEDFSQEQAARYPRIDEIHTTPVGPVGTPWGDVAVTGAAQIAAVLADEWERLTLARIVPAGRKPARAGFEYEYALYTRAGTRIDWGRSPGTDSPGETPPADKLARLREYFNEHGSLDTSGTPTRLRFAETGQLQAETLAPVKPLP